MCRRKNVREIRRASKNMRNFQTRCDGLARDLRGRRRWRGSGRPQAGERWVHAVVVLQREFKAAQAERAAGASKLGLAPKTPGPAKAFLGGDAPASVRRALGDVSNANRSTVKVARLAVTGLANGAQMPGSVLKAAIATPAVSKPRTRLYPDEIEYAPKPQPGSHMPLRRQ